MTETVFEPRTLADAEAMERAAARIYAARIEAMLAVMNGPEAIAFEQCLAAELAEGVPAFTSAASNLPAAANWFAQIRAGLASDHERLSAMAGLTPPEEPAEGEAETSPPV